MTAEVDGEIQDEEEAPVPPESLVRLVDRFVVDRAINHHQIQRLAAMSGVEGGVETLRRVLTVAGVVACSQSGPDVSAGYNTEDEPPSREERESELGAVRQETNPRVETREGQGAFVLGAAARNEAIAAARRLMASDRFDPEPDRRTLTPQEEWGLCILLRNGKPLNEELPKKYVSSLPPDGEAYRAWTALVVHNLRLVRKFAAAYADRGLEDQDLHQHGALGLMTAIRKFDVTRRNKLSTYAAHWIHQSVERGVCNEGSTIRLPVHVHEVLHRLRKAEEELRSKGRRVSREELRLQTGYSPEKIDLYFRTRRGVFSLEEPVGEGVVLGDLVHDERSAVRGPEEALEPRFGRERVEAVLSLLPSRQAFVIRHRIGVVGGDPWTLAQIGEELGVTRERVRQLEAKAYESIRALALESGCERNDVSVHRQYPMGDVLDAAIAGGRIPRRGGWAFSRGGVDQNGPSERALRTRYKRHVLGTLRGCGYTITTALAEVVDNSVTTGATTVRIEYCSERGRTWLAVVDDGRGMEATELREAMRLSPVVSSHGLGEQTERPVPAIGKASLSQARVSTVLTRSATGQVKVRTWDVSTVDARGQWRVGRCVDRETLVILDRLGFTGRGTAVLWRDTDELGHGVEFQERIREASGGLALLFHRYLEGRELRILVGGEELAPRDPLLRMHPATQNRGTEVLQQSGSPILVNPVVLPHPSRLTSEDASYVSEFPRSPARQGFYVYVGERLVVAGDWLGLPDLQNSEETSLACVSVVLPPELASVWRVDVPRQRACPPTPSAERLVMLAQEVRERSVRVFSQRYSGP